MAKTPITELDFFKIKNQLKDFLRADPSGRFKDFDFEGSNMSALLDVLAYNTYQNNFYTNMAISEMFLDTAQLRNSVVSHAKELNYLPRSNSSSAATVSVTIRDSSVTDSSILIPRGTRFTTAHSGQKYNFYTEQGYTARRIEAGVFVADNVHIFEGELIEESFILDSSSDSIRLSNDSVDTSSIRVFINYDNLSEREEFIYSKDIFGVSNNDNIFYLEPSFDLGYSIAFGKNIFGRKPTPAETITVFYRIASGFDSNGACRFTSSFRSNVTVSTLENATGGSQGESLEDIKFFAPRSIQIQERAVSEKDYEILLKQRFNEIVDVSVIGGDELDPPQFGKVAIATNVNGSLSNSLISKYTTFLRDKTPIGIQPIFIEPKFLYVSLLVEVFYDQNKTKQSPQELEHQIRIVLKDYNSNNLEKFESIFELSRVSSMIDSISPAIINNTLDASPYILYTPDLNRVENPSFNFGSPLDTPCRFARSNNSEVYKRYVESSAFTYEGTQAYFEDNGLGEISILESKNRSEGVFNFIRKNAGVVDYETGLVKLSDFKVDFYESPGIRIKASTVEKNVSAPKDTILSLKDSDVEVVLKELKNR